MVRARRHSYLKVLIQVIEHKKLFVVVVVVALVADTPPIKRWLAKSAYDNPAAPRCDGGVHALITHS